MARMTTVGECMSTDVSAVPPDATLTEVAQQMRISGVGSVPVLDSAGEECVGILTERDIVVRVLAEEHDPRVVLARDIATLHPFTCVPGEDLTAAAARMREHEVQHLPVVAEGRVVGVISLADIFFGRPDEERGTIAPPRAMSR
jgi:CBS domain-containing protein